jgi:hypothetical protein
MCKIGRPCGVETADKQGRFQYNRFIISHLIHWQQQQQQHTGTKVNVLNLTV